MGRPTVVVVAQRPILGALPAMLERGSGQMGGLAGPGVAGSYLACQGLQCAPYQPQPVIPCRKLHPSPRGVNELEAIRGADLSGGGARLTLTG